MKTRRPDPRKVYANDADRQTARRVRHYQRGLNSQGKPYQRHPNFVNHGESPSNQAMQRQQSAEHKRAADLARYHEQAAGFRKRGLRVDGTPFRRHKNFHTWQQFREGLAI